MIPKAGPCPSDVLIIAASRGLYKFIGSYFPFSFHLRNGGAGWSMDRLGAGVGSWAGGVAACDWISMMGGAGLDGVGSASVGARIVSAGMIVAVGSVGSGSEWWFCGLCSGAPSFGLPIEWSCAT